MTAGSVFADDKLWDMKDWADVTVNVDGTYEVDGLTFYGQQKCSVQKSNNTFGDGTVTTYQIKTGGDGQNYNGSPIRMFEFEVEAGNTVTVYAKHGSSSGDARYAWISTEIPAKNKTCTAENATVGVIETLAGGIGYNSFKIENAGKVYVSTIGNVGICAIKVSSQSPEYLELTAAINTAHDAFTKTSQSISHYAVELEPVFTGITKNLNNYARQIQDARDTLNVAEEAGKTAERYDEIIGMLPNTSDIEALVVRADELAAAYKGLDFKKYEDNLAALDKHVDSLDVAVKGWAADSTAFVTDSLGTIKVQAADACAELNLDSRTSEFEDKLATITAMTDNVRLRATEQDSILRAIAPVRETLETIQKVADDLNKKAHASESVKTYIAELKALGEELDGLQNKADRDSVRLSGYNTTITEWTNELKTISDNINEYKAKLNDAAYEAQLAYQAEAQEKKDEYYYRISSKYENDSEKLKENQIAFAEIQQRLDVEKTDSIEAKHSAGESVEYNETAYANIGAIISEMDLLWTAALNELEQEMIENNNKNFEEWVQWNDSLHTAYTEAIQKVEGYKNIEGVKDDYQLLEKIKTAEVNLFPIIDDINALNEEATQKKDDCNINPEDGTVSRFEIDEYTERAEDIFDNIKQSVEDARTHVNDVAYNYVKSNLYNIKHQFDYANVTNESEADSLDNLRTSTVEAAQTRADKAYMDGTMADSIDVVLAMVEGVQKMIDAIEEEDEAHTAVDNEKKKVQIYWTQAWGNRDEENEEALNALHDTIEAFEKECTESIGSMTDKKDELIAKADSIYNEIFKIAEPEAYNANETAYNEVKDALDELNKLIEDTKATVGAYSDDVKGEYLPALEEISTSAIETKLEEYHKALTMADNKDVLMGCIDNLTARVNGIASAAAAAEESQKEPSADVNGDGTIDAADVEAVKAGVSGNEYSAETDLNRDGKVDVLDLTLVIKAYLSQQQ